MGDKPVQPLTLFRLTLETDDEQEFIFIREFFKGDKLTALALVKRLGQPNGHKDLLKHWIGCESRIRERLKR